MRGSLLLLAPLMAVLLAGCATKGTVVVLPEDGPVGGVVVQSGGKIVVLDRAYAADHPGDSQASQSTPEEVRSEFSDALDAFPIQPSHYTLYFKTNKSDQSDMLADSQKSFSDDVFPDVRRRIAEKKPVEIVLIGHTDTTATPDYNDKLSLERAQTIAQMLEDELKNQKDLPPMHISTEGRGQHDDTSDPPGTDNQKQRYVEIIVQ